MVLTLKQKISTQRINPAGQCMSPTMAGLVAEVLVALPRAGAVTKTTSTMAPQATATSSAPLWLGPSTPGHRTFETKRQPEYGEFATQQYKINCRE